ncbi:diguanylate cyclase [Thiomicrorhabdus sp. zzn3]|uniref:diguanylate cyclase domain-containing protein n=1 Tax=Thiomicrorhabdus sp. zzn3 TaxID=3039775 RepID=UPI002436E421|nr:diguanylate cyclase [Thiomicrorhabdus sp. zzn3]MDG6778126.1 diguanylate cyclase [Thiomicrorhabdus sp. zzn3]
MRLIKLSILFAGWLLGVCVYASPAALKPVKLQLKWQHQFQFAGYYAALEKGFYRDAGLDVSLVEADVGTDSIQAVLAGEAEFGVGTSELMVNYYHGDPVVVLAAIMQHSPLALATLKASGIANIHQLASQTLMIEPNSSELFAYLKNEGIELERLRLVEHSHHTQDLIDGKVEAMSIYTTDETFDFENRGVDYQLFRPSMSGIDFYGDNLFTTQSLIDRDPQLVDAFRQASLKGWKYAIRHPEEMIDLIVSKYSQRKTRAHLRYEAEKMSVLMEPDFVEIGYINPGRWQSMAHAYVQLGLLPETFKVDGMLYQLDKEHAYQQLKQQFYWALAVLLVVMLMAAIFYRLYRLANLRRKQFETLFLNAPISLMEVDQKGVIHNWNREAENTFLYSAEEAVGQNALDLLVPKHRAGSVDAMITSAWKSNQTTYSENLNIRKDGHELLCNWANMPIETEDKNHKHVICMARDITAEKEMEEKLYQAAHYDDLTGLPNRALVLSLLREALADAKRHQSRLAVLFIDLNEFKPINDSFGHQVGDEVLKQSGLRIRQALRRNDLVGRLSGDEFLAVIKDLKHEDHLQRVIDKIYQAIRPVIVVDDLKLNVSASIGFSVYPKDAQDVQKLIRMADQSMYQVKATGNRTVN